MFETIINEAREKFSLGDKAGTLLASLLGLIANPKNGGFSGFIQRFDNAGFGDTVDSWISDGDNTPISGEQIESALGSETVEAVAAQSEVDRAAAAPALGFMTPRVVDALTPDGEIPDEASLLSSITGFLTDHGGAVGAAILGGLGTAGIFASDLADAADDDPSEKTLVLEKNVSDSAEKTLVLENAAIDTNAAAVQAETVELRDAGKQVVAVGGVGNKVAAAPVAETEDDNDDGILKWLLPLLLLGMVIGVGYWFFDQSTPVGSVPSATPRPTANVNRAAANTNANRSARTADASFRIDAIDGKYTVSGVVPDQATFDRIRAALIAQYGEANVDFAGLKVDAAAKPLAAGWWDNFNKMLPSLKDWKTGSLAFAGNAVTTAAGLPQAAIEQLKALFTGWTLPASVTTVPAEVPRNLTEVALPNGTKLQAYPGGIEDQLIGFIQSEDYKNASADSLKERWFDFDDLNFKFGTTELVPESKRQLDNIVAILKAFPDVKIKIGGYTDKKGDDAGNKRLSDGRAKAVKAALEKAGVGAQVPEAEGYGEERATVDENASDEDRKIDRKTSVRLIK